MQVPPHMSYLSANFRSCSILRFPSCQRSLRLARWFLATFLDPNDFGLYLLCASCRCIRNVCRKFITLCAHGFLRKGVRRQIASNLGQGTNLPLWTNEIVTIPLVRGQFSRTESSFWRGILIHITSQTTASRRDNSF